MNNVKDQSKTEVCFSCGEGLQSGSESSGQSGELLCSHCEASAEHGLSHYYMQQYYYRFAD